jgi:hypothetical protein
MTRLQARVSGPGAMPGYRLTERGQELRRMFRGIIGRRTHDETLRLNRTKDPHRAARRRAAAKRAAQQATGCARVRPAKHGGKTNAAKKEARGWA